MDCPTAREWLLSADTAELRPGGHTALARHLHTCAGCRASAQGVLDDLRLLELQHATPPGPGAVDRAVQRALHLQHATTTRPAAVDRGVQRALGVTHSRRRAARVRRTAFALPLAAAAAFTLYLAGEAPLRMRWDDAASPPPAAALPPMPAPPAAPVVNAPADRAVAIFGTSDPRITVVWYF